jgi:hypothetical protein
MFEAGFSLEENGDYVGHNSAYMTDRYRHLREGHEARAAERFDAYLTWPVPRIKDRAPHTSWDPEKDGEEEDGGS